MSSDIRQDALREVLPRNHRAILEAVRSVAAGTHLTALDVHGRTRLLAPKIGFATVHRGLARLSDLGYVHKVDVPGATSAVYEQAASPHAHFRCVVCGDIRDVEFRVSAEQIAVLAAQLGLQIAAESTTFAGRCANCTSAVPASSSRSVRLPVG